MDILMISLIGLNMALTLFFGIRFMIAQKENAKFRIEYFESSSDIGLIRKTNKVVINAQVFYGPIPIGGPMVLAEKTVQRIDEAELQLIKQEVVRPLLKLGIRVMEMKSGINGAIRAKLGGS